MARILKTGLIALALLATPLAARAEINRLRAAQNVPATVAKLLKAVKARRLKVFAVIDHAAGAKSAGMTLPPAVLVVFGNPKIGTPLMQASPTMGLELPIRMLVWQDKQGRTWIGYVPPAAMARRRGVPTDHPVIRRMGKALDAVAREAAR
jgi:uncharacterized protein (DUF302 family)